MLLLSHGINSKSRPISLVLLTAFISELCFQISFIIVRRAQSVEVKMIIYSSSAISILLNLAVTVLAARLPVISEELVALAPSGTDSFLRPRSTPVGPGPNCTAETTYREYQASVTIKSPNGTVIGGNSTIPLPHKGWFNLDSRLPWTLAMKLQKHNLLLQYSNDEPWTVQQNTPTSSVFDCRDFKFWLITNFWPFEESKHIHQGTLNWTIVALDGTKLGGSPQTDLMENSGHHPVASLDSALAEVIDVYWGKNNAMTFKYGQQTAKLDNATGSHQTMLIGSAPMDVFTWTKSGVL